MKPLTMLAIAAFLITLAILYFAVLRRTDSDPVEDVVASTPCSAYCAGAPSGCSSICQNQGQSALESCGGPNNPQCYAQVLYQYQGCLGNCGPGNPQCMSLCMTPYSEAGGAI